MTKKTVKLKKNISTNGAATQKNTENVKENVKQQKELKYVYPSDRDKMTELDKKAFRRQARAKNKSFKKQLNEISDEKERAKVLKDARAWAKETYTNTGMPSFD